MIGYLLHQYETSCKNAYSAIVFDDDRFMRVGIYCDDQIAKLVLPGIL